MKLTRLFAVSLAALSVMSCSNEIIEDTKHGVTLNPGDALIELNLSNGITSYAADMAEKEIKNRLYKLYNKATGTEVPVTDTNSSDPTKIVFTVAKAEIDKIAGGAAQLLVAANTTGFTSDGTTAVALPATYAAASKLRVQGALTDNQAALANGLPASATYDLTLKEGTITVPTTKLKRVAARLHVKATTMSLIKGYTVKYSGPDSTQLFMPLASTGANLEYTYTVQGDIATGTSKTEPVGYMYPTNNVALEIKGGGLTKSATIAKVGANKNYGIKITPKPTTDGSVDFDISIDEWEDVGGGDVDVDFNTTLLKPTGNQVLPTGLAVVDGTLTLTPQSTPALGSFDSEIFGPDAVNLEEVSFSPITTYAAGNDDKAISPDGKLKIAMDAGGSLIHFTALYAYGEDKTYTIYCKTGAGRPDTYSKFEVKVKGFGYPEGFSVPLEPILANQAMEIMHLNTTGTKAGDLAFFNKVNATTGASFVEKAIAYVNGDAAKRIEMLAGQYNAFTAKGAICPEGFRAPTQPEIYGIFSRTLGATDVKLPLTHNTDVSLGNSKILRMVSYSGNPETDGGKNYYTFTDKNGAKLFIPGNSNMTSITDNPEKGLFRITFWGAEFQSGNGISTSQNTANSSMRCVKIQQSPLS